MTVLAGLDLAGLAERGRELVEAEAEGARLVEFLGAGKLIVE